MNEQEANRVAEYIARDCHKAIEDVLAEIRANTPSGHESTLRSITLFGQMLGVTILAVRLGGITVEEAKSINSLAEELTRPHYPEAEAEPKTKTANIEIVPG